MTTTSRQLAVFNGSSATTIGKNAIPAMTINYTRIDTEEHKDASVTYVIGKISQESADNVRALKPGDKFTIVKKKEGDFWNLDSVLPESAYTPAAKKPYQPSEGGGFAFKTSATTATKSTGYNDQVGLKIGAARNQAIAFLAATKGQKFTLDDVDRVSMEIVGRQAAQEDALRSDPTLGKYNAATQAAYIQDPVTDMMDQDLGVEAEESPW